MGRQVIPAVGGATTCALLAGQILGAGPGLPRPSGRGRCPATTWCSGVGYQALIVPADHVMATGMLRGLKRPVEGAR